MSDESTAKPRPDGASASPNEPHAPSAPPPTMDLVSRALAPYAAHLRGAHRDPASEARFIEATTPRDLARARAIGRQRTADDVLAWWRHEDAFERFAETASEDAMDAARTLATRWPDISARAARALADRLADWCVLPQAEAVVCGPAFDAFARHWCTADVAALDRIDAGSGAALIALRATTVDRDEAPPWPPLETPDSVAAALLREHANRCTEAALERAADHARGALADALERDAADVIPDALLDPGEEPAWARLVPALPVADDRAFLTALAHTATRFGDVQPATLAAALAASPEQRSLRAASLGVALLADGAPPLRPSGWVHRLAARPEAAPPERPSRGTWIHSLALVAGACSWATLVALAQRVEGPSTVAALLEERDDWDDFDAPGEGELPTLWWRVMVLAEALSGTSTAAIREALIDAGADGGDDDTDASVDTLLRRVFDDAVSVVEATATRRSVEGSPMSGYAHGLNDGVGEAYGDVYSPADPFSGRPRDEDA